MFALKLTTIAVLPLVLACTPGAPAKAPLSNAEDLSPESHRDAATIERARAEEHETQAESPRNEFKTPFMKWQRRAQHHFEADTHRDYTQQHEQAAEDAERNAAAPAP